MSRRFFLVRGMEMRLKDHNLRSVAKFMRSSAHFLPLSLSHDFSPLTFIFLPSHFLFILFLFFFTRKICLHRIGLHVKSESYHVSTSSTQQLLHILLPTSIHSSHPTFFFSSPFFVSSLRLISFLLTLHHSLLLPTIKEATDTQTTPSILIHTSLRLITNVFSLSLSLSLISELSLSLSDL